GLGTMVGGVAIIAGLYALLYAVSSGKWVGFGDVKLNVGLGLIVGWQGALVVVFLANLIGMLVILPGLVTKRLTKTSRIPFGPFLITACIVTVLWGEQLINWYIHSFLSL
ncbi:MAG: A24 family peptidase, partial [Candidatus Saccharimonadales bacterium]